MSDPEPEEAHDFTQELLGESDRVAGRYSLSAFQGWIDRTGGETPMNDEERLEFMLQSARYGSSFAGSELLWAVDAAREEGRKRGRCEILREFSEWAADRLGPAA